MRQACLVADSPRIAVLIPCFNDGATLGETVRSAREQEPCEIAVADDGSTDPATLEVLEGLASDGILVLRQANAGSSAARNAAAEATTAPYVFPIDADDRLLPHRLSALADQLDASPQLTLVWGRYRTFGERERERSVAETLDPWSITYYQDIPASFMVRREALRAAGGWKLRGFESWELLCALAALGCEGRGFDTLIYEYRLHGPRKLDQMLGRYDELHGEMRALHPNLFAQRRANRRRSPAPRLLKVAVPLIDSLPIHGWTKHRLWSAVGHVAYRRGGYGRIALRLLRKTIPSRPARM
jgi:glycosyltransferase involved in cell wall biosynthesis